MGNTKQVLRCSSVILCTAQVHRYPCATSIPDHFRRKYSTSGLFEALVSFLNLGIRGVQKGRFSGKGSSK